MADNLKFIITPELSQSLTDSIETAVSSIKVGFDKAESSITHNMANISSSMANSIGKGSEDIKSKLSNMTGSLNSGWKGSANIFKKSFNTNFRQIRVDWKKSIREMNKNSKKFKPPKSVINGWQKLGGIIAGAFTVNAIKNFGNESIELYKAQSLVENKLRANMKTVKLYAGDTNKMNQAMENFKNMTSEIQDKGVIGDEVLLAGASQLTTFQLTDKAISKLLPKMADMAVNQKGINATQEDMFGIANQLGKALATGSLAALADSGIVMDENTKKLFANAKGMERVNILEKILAENVGKVNEEMAKTPEGQIQNAQNAWGDMKETIGKAVIPIVVKFNKILKDNLPKIQNFLMNIAEKLPGAFDKFLEIGNKVIKFLDNLHESIGLDNIALFVGSFMAIAKVVPIIIGVVKAVKALKTGTLALNATILANPIALAIAGIATLAYVVYKNWDSIKAYLSKTWEDIKTSFSNVWESAKNSFNSFVDGALGLWQTFKNSFSGVIDFVKSLIVGYISIYQEMINAVIRGVNKVSKIIPGFEGFEEVDFVSKVKQSLNVEQEPTKGFEKDVSKGTVVFENKIDVTLPTTVSNEFKTEVTDSIKKASINEKIRQERGMGLR